MGAGLAGLDLTLARLGIPGLDRMMRIRVNSIDFVEILYDFM